MTTRAKILFRIKVSSVVLVLSGVALIYGVVVNDPYIYLSATVICAWSISYMADQAFKLDDD